MPLLTLMLACVGAATPSPETDPRPDPTDTDTGAPDTDSGAPDSDTDTSPGVDADGDGYVAESDGGDDCDDANPNVHPGAEDWCTAVDEDCDGIAIADGRCSDTQAFLSRATRLDADTNVGMLPVRDLTGDGLDDVLLNDSSGNFAVSPGDGTWGAFAGWPIQAQWVACSRNYVHLDLGDIDGDGYNDVAAPACGEGGGIEVSWGPFDGSELNPPTTWWEGPETDGWLGQRWADADGDGRPELFYWSRDDVTDEVEVRLFFGGQRDAVEATFTSERSTNVAFDRLGDVDGDGCDDFEIAYGWDDEPTWFSGATVTRDLVAAREDVMAGMITHVANVDMDGATYPEWLAVGDWSGDGLDDAIFVDMDPHRGSLLYYDDFTSTPDDVSPSGTVSNDDVIEDHIGYFPGVIHENGVPRIVFLSNNSDQPEQYILLPDDWHTGTNNLSEVRHLVLDNDFGGSWGAAVATSWGRGDIDQDGWSDVIVGTTSDAWYLASFADIPWSEDRYW